MNKVEIKDQAWRNELYKQLQESVIYAGPNRIGMRLLPIYDDDGKEIDKIVVMRKCDFDWLYARM